MSAWRGDREPPRPKPMRGTRYQNPLGTQGWVLSTEGMAQIEPH